MFFVVLWFLIFIPAIIHILIDRNPRRRTRGRVLELLFYWQLGMGGALSIFGGLGHITPGHEEIADQIGFAQSPFQWEVGFADIAAGVIMMLAAWKRGNFIIPAIVAISIMYIGDAIGHLWQWYEHDNNEPYNTYSIPTDLGQPILLIIFYFLVRRERPEALELREPRHQHTAPAA